MTSGSPFESAHLGELSTHLPESAGWSPHQCQPCRHCRGPPSWTRVSARLWIGRCVVAEWAAGRSAYLSKDALGEFSSAIDHVDGVDGGRVLLQDRRGVLVQSC